MLLRRCSLGCKRSSRRSVRLLGLGLGVGVRGRSSGRRSGRRGGFTPRSLRVMSCLCRDRRMTHRRRRRHRGPAQHSQVNRGRRTRRSHRGIGVRGDNGRCGRWGIGGEALRQELLVSPAGRGVAEGGEGVWILGGEGAGCPAEVAEVDVAVGVDVAEGLADVFQAAGVGVAAADFRKDGLAVLGAEPGGEGREGVIDVVVDAVGVGARVVDVEVLVHVEDEVVCGAVEVGDFGEGGGGAGADELLGGGVLGAGHEDHLRDGAGVADGGYGGLDGGAPGVDVGHCGLGA